MTCLHLLSGKPKAKVFAVGENGLPTEIAQAGFRIVRGPHVELVIVGMPHA